MTAVKHTPEPWTYERGEYVRCSQLAPGSNKGAAVAHLANLKLFGLEQYEANGRLISAAPVMANKLKGCCERLCQACCRGVEHPDSHCGAADIRQLLKKAGLL